MIQRLFPFAMAIIALTACSNEARPQGGSSGEDSSSASNPPAAPVAADNPTRGGDGSAIMLSPLSVQEIDDAGLQGELGCSFTGDTAAEPLLVAKADVGDEASGFGIVKIGDHVSRIATRGRGGFGAMEREGAFGGRGITIDIEQTAEEPAIGGEAPAWPAALTAKRMDGAERRFAGLWRCGP